MAERSQGCRLKVRRRIEVECGKGNLTLTAKLRDGRDGEVHGIDAAPEMFREAERKASARGLEIQFQTGLIENLEFPDDRFDVVLSSLMLHHLPKDHKRQEITEIARVLKSGGRFLAVDVDPWRLGNLQTVVNAVESQGFSSIERGKTGFKTLWIPVHFLKARSSSGGDA